jgi:phosphoserine aminotransferase
MNVPFLLRGKYATEALEKTFLEFVKTKNIVGVKGHRLVGGFRASMYNACTMEDVNALIAAMKEFEAKVK